MITDWKPSVFISSTMNELAMERNALEKALKDLGMHVWLYENQAGARSNPIQQTYVEGIAASDIYIGLFWQKYGQFTINEYNKARELKKPCLIYVKRVEAEEREKDLADFLQHIHRVTDPKGLTDCPFNTIEALIGQAPKDVERLLVKSGRLVDAQNREWLLTQAQNLWIRGVFERSLSERVPIVLGLQQQYNALPNPLRNDVQETDLPPHELRPGTLITEVYEQAGGELLILGERGAGKTILLLELMRALLERARHDKYHPIPLIFHLSRWVSKRKPLAVWLIEETKAIYQVSHELAQKLIEKDLVLPLLDGLDEVEAAYRDECVNFINVYHSLHQTLPLVVCSRSTEYMTVATTTSSYMAVRMAVTVLPLTMAQINDYLSQSLGDLVAVKQTLQEDAELRSLATTPLILSILIIAYEGKSVQDLEMEGRPEVRRQKIFAAYIKRVLERGRRVLQYPESLTIKQLSWLARQMKRHNQTNFYIEELQVNWLSIKWIRLMYHTVIGLIFGPVIFLAFGAFIGLFTAFMIALKAGLAAGVVIGVVGGLVIGLRDGPGSLIQPTEGIAWSFENFRTDFFPRLKRGLRKHLPGALIFGILLGLIGGLFVGMEIGVIGGGFAGVVLWLIIVLTEKPDGASPNSTGLKGVLENFSQVWLFLLSGGVIASVRAGLIAGLSNKPFNVNQRSTPNQGIRRSARYAAIFGLTFALIFGPLFGLIGRVIVGPGAVLHFVLSGVISSGLLSALVFGGEACTKHFILRLLLRLETGIPWNYPRFLDYAAEHILLNKVGGQYMFIHSLLLEHFATHLEE